jgi:hypothetical protein
MDEINREVFEQKLDARISKGFHYTAKGVDGKWTIAAAIPTFIKFVELYIEANNAGRVSNSVFEIVERELVQSGELRPIAVEDKSAGIAQKIADFEAGKIPVYNFRLACKADRELRDAYERFTGLAQLASPAR